MIKDLPRGAYSSEDYPDTATAHWLDERAYAPKLAYNDPMEFYAGNVGRKDIGIVDNRHIVTFAGSRAGKGTSAIIPNLLRYQGSMIVLDPKGENAAITAGVRRNTCNQSNVKVLDPFNASGRAKDALYAGSFNPLSKLDVNNDYCVDDARGMAEAIIIESGGETHFSDAARNLVTGLILAVITKFPEGDSRRSLIGVRMILMQSWDKLKSFLEVVAGDAAKSHTHLIAAQEANAIISTPDDERGSIISTAKTQTSFLDSPAMRRVLINTNIDMDDLKLAPTTVYLCLPAMRLGTYSRWLRLMINSALESMERVTAKNSPVMFVLDEFHVLGHMAQIERAAGLMAGYGMQLWTILQDINQIEKSYPKSWETFLGNAGIVQAFGNTDEKTCAYLSKLLGNTSVKTASIGDTNFQQTIAGQSGVSEQRATVPLVQPDEIARLFRRDNNNQIIKLAGAPPLQLDRLPYFERDDFMTLIEQNQ